MTQFDHQRRGQSILQVDIDGLRRGWYSDKYFENSVHVLEGAKASDYGFAGQPTRPLPIDPAGVEIGDLEVEAQIFNRRRPYAVVAGTDVALTMLRHASGMYQGQRYRPGWKKLEVAAVEDGALTRFAGDTEDVDPVIRVRGRYREFALLETPILGVLTRASRIATNCYDVLSVSNGKPILFFPARFDLPQTQAVDGYAYYVAVQRYNHETSQSAGAFVSTDAQAAWWGGRGGGTLPHALVACFLGDTAEAMVAYARYARLDVPRMALVDFNNDAVGASRATLAAYWPHYAEAYARDDAEGMQRWTLSGVRLDHSAKMRDLSLPDDAPTGVSAELVRMVRAALDSTWEGWQVPSPLTDAARDFCRGVKIVVSGGFNRDRIQQFEANKVPVDMYGVGSSLLQSTSDTSTDYTMDIVRVKLAGQWVDMAKLGRKANDNPELFPVDLSLFA
jgi:nicotinate phosphoribosyltransferase